MRRETIFTQQSPKCLTGNDKPLRSAKVFHLNTLPGFLSEDIDHSLFRPFTNKMSPAKKRHFQLAPRKETDFMQKKKKCPETLRKLTESHRIISFNPYEPIDPIKKHTNSLFYTSDFESQSIPLGDMKIGKRIKPHSTSSVQMKSVITHY